MLLKHGIHLRTVTRTQAHGHSCSPPSLCQGSKSWPLNWIVKDQQSCKGDLAKESGKETMQILLSEWAQSVLSVLAAVKLVEHRLTVKDSAKAV